MALSLSELCLCWLYIAFKSYLEESFTFCFTLHGNLYTVVFTLHVAFTLENPFCCFKIAQDLHLVIYCFCSFYIAYTQHLRDSIFCCLQIARGSNLAESCFCRFDIVLKCSYFAKSFFCCFYIACDLVHITGKIRAEQLLKMFGLSVRFRCNIKL